MTLTEEQEKRLSEILSPLYLEAEASFAETLHVNLNKHMAEEIERAVEAEFKTILDMLESGKTSDAPISITVEQYLKGRLALTTKEAE